MNRKCLACGKEPGIITTSWSKWLGAQIARAWGTTIVVAAWYFGGFPLLAAYFGLTLLIGLSLVAAKRKGEL